MTETATTSSALAVFADPGAEIWAVLIGGEQPRLALGPVDAAGPGNPAGIEPQWTAVDVDRDDGEVWSIGGRGAAGTPSQATPSSGAASQATPSPGTPSGGRSSQATAPGTVELRLELAGASTYTYEDGSALQPCRLSGNATIGGVSVELDIPGVLLDDLPTGKIDSIRVVGSWFPGGHEISLLSVRPEGAKGQAGDLLDVVARGEQEKLVFDPRLSTTYGPDGLPRKAGIELWLGDDEDGEQSPRRVSGVASGSVVSVSVSGTDGPTAADGFSGYAVNAHALHCLSRGEEGSGVYVLLRAA